MSCDNTKRGGRTPGSGGHGLVAAGWRVFQVIVGVEMISIYVAFCNTFL